MAVSKTGQLAYWVDSGTIHAFSYTHKGPKMFVGCQPRGDIVGRKYYTPSKIRICECEENKQGALQKLLTRLQQQLEHSKKRVVVLEDELAKVEKLLAQEKAA
jgi:hypothetical protein